MEFLMTGLWWTEQSVPPLTQISAGKMCSNQSRQALLREDLLLFWQEGSIPLKSLENLTDSCQNLHSGSKKGSASIPQLAAATASGGACKWNKLTLEAIAQLVLLS